MSQKCYEIFCSALANFQANIYIINIRIFLQAKSIFSELFKTLNKKRYTLFFAILEKMGLKGIQERNCIVNNVAWKIFDTVCVTNISTEWRIWKKHSTLILIFAHHSFQLKQSIAEFKTRKNTFFCVFHKTWWPNKVRSSMNWYNKQQKQMKIWIFKLKLCRNKRENKWKLGKNHEQNVNCTKKLEKRLGT